MAGYIPWFGKKRERLSPSREEMVGALRRIMVPALRGRGFSGSFPHLRRLSPTGIDLFTFQFDRHGGGFIIELGRSAPGGLTTYWGKVIPPNKVTVWDLHPDHRHRLQPAAGPGTDSWFRFESKDVDKVARSVLPFLAAAESWYAATLLAGGPGAG
jgi:hypothetical protein